MTIQYDRVADAVYMKLADTKVAKTMEINDNLIIDLDSEGKMIGVEILEASSQDALIKNLQVNVENGMGVPVYINESTPTAV